MPVAAALAVPSLPLEEQVQSALSSSPYVAKRQLRFEAAAGQVTLRGTVGSYFQKQMAQEAVRNIAGVERIDNQLEVHWAS